MDFLRISFFIKSIFLKICQQFFLHTEKTYSSLRQRDLSLDLTRKKENNALFILYISESHICSMTFYLYRVKISPVKPSPLKLCL